MKLYIILGILAVIIIWFICTLNKFIYLRRRIDRSKSLIDVFLKERFDLIPNLVESCKGYLNYEKETLSK
ncbi:MAG TPA: LemA family protein, partial [Candidatus Onthocola stercoravium]|nr:LemA family protein [Candidatus Onthocola stercoravium]